MNENIPARHDTEPAKIIFYTGLRKRNAIVGTRFLERFARRPLFDVP
jgi:hypothetical protein